jgi:hypothetical protein
MSAGWSSGAAATAANDVASIEGEPRHSRRKRNQQQPLLSALFSSLSFFPSSSSSTLPSPVALNDYDQRPNIVSATIIIVSAITIILFRRR